MGQITDDSFPPTAYLVHSDSTEVTSLIFNDLFCRNVFSKSCLSVLKNLSLQGVMRN